MAYQSGPISSFAEKIPSSTDYIPIVDSTDPFVKNKKATIGNLFRGVPYSSGSTSPAIAFGSSNNSGIFSPNGTQVGIRVGNTSSFNVIKSTGVVTISASDTSSSNLDLTLRAHGSSGKINFSSQAVFTDTNFSINSSANSTNSIKFNLKNNGLSTISVSTGGTLVTEEGIQSLSNKTIISPSIIGDLIINSDTSDMIVSNGRVGIGVAAPDLDVKLHIYESVKASGPTSTFKFSTPTKTYSLINDDTDFKINLAESTLVTFSSDKTIFANDLHVGDGQSQGIVLKAPNGQKYRIIVNNSGELNTVAIN